MLNHTGARTDRHFIPPSKEWLKLHISCDILRGKCVVFGSGGQICRSPFKFQSHDPRAVKHYYPRVSSAECSPPGTDASGWLVCLAAGPSHATTSTWPQFSTVEGYNSPKVAGQTIVYATARYCQVKGKRARPFRKYRGLLPAAEECLSESKYNACVLFFFKSK